MGCFLLVSNVMEPYEALERMLCHLNWQEIDMFDNNSSLDNRSACMSGNLSDNNQHYAAIQAMCGAQEVHVVLAIG